MQAAFMDNWIETCSKVLHAEPYFPQLHAAGEHAAQVFKSSADDASESVRLMYLLSIAAAMKSVRIANAYFVPDSLAVTTLVAARRRGAKVEIIVPNRHTDSDLVRHASRSLWGPLLEAGIEIYEYQPTMFHVKMVIVDEIWTSVGSTNFDNRSFRLNDEANLNILDADFAAAQARIFEEDKARARQVTLEEWLHRPWRERATDRLASLLRLQL
jgi:cardiolipin synthase